MKLLAHIRIGFLHAAFHRNMKQAEVARKQHDIVKFKDHIYAAENAWKKLVIVKNKYKIK